MPAGDFLAYTLRFYPRDHVVASGHAIELVLTGADLGCWGPGADPDCEGTGILPVERPVAHTVRTGAPAATRLHLPVATSPGPERALTELDGWLRDVPE